MRLEEGRVHGDAEGDDGAEAGKKLRGVGEVRRILEPRRGSDPGEIRPEIQHAFFDCFFE
jgi:hypothetical protein